MKEVLRKKYIIVGLLFIILGGALLRLYSLDHQSYWIDEGFTLMQVLAIADHGYPLLSSGFVEKKDILLPYILTPLTWVVHIDNEWVFRSASALFGVLSIVVAFFIGRQLWDRRAGLLYAFLMSFSYWHVAWSRQVRGYELMVFFTLLTIFFLAKYDAVQQKRYIVGVLISSLLAILAKSFSILLLPILCIYFLFRREYIISIVLIIGGSAVAFFYKYLFIGALSSDHPNYLFEYLIEYLFGYYGLFFVCALVGFLIVMHQERSQRVLHGALFGFFVASLSFFSFFVYVLEYRYLFVLSIWLFLYVAYFGYFLISHLRYEYVFVVLLLFVGMDYFGWGRQALVFIPQKEYVLEGYTPQVNFRELYKDLDLEKGDVVISTYPYMDTVYLGRSDYALPISYTGRSLDTTIRGKQEYYSGTRSIFGYSRDGLENRIQKVSRGGSVYIILDSLALRRLDDDTLQYLGEKTRRIQSVRSFNERDEGYVYQVIQ